MEYKLLGTLEVVTGIIFIYFVYVQFIYIHVTVTFYFSSVNLFSGLLGRAPLLINPDVSAASAVVIFSRSSVCRSGPSTIVDISTGSDRESFMFYLSIGVD